MPLGPGERRWAQAVASGALLSGIAAIVLPVAVMTVGVGFIAGLVTTDGDVFAVLWRRWPWLLLSFVACQQALGWWFLTTVRGSRDVQRRRRRAAIRALGGASVLLFVSAMVLTLVGRPRVGYPWGELPPTVWLIGVPLAATVCLAAAHLLALGEAAHIARRAGGERLAERLAGLRRMPSRVLMFWGGAILLTPVVMLMDLILGLAGLIYLVSVNLLMPTLLIGSVVASGATMASLGRKLGRAAA